jgi:hypothetical protein
MFLKNLKEDMVIKVIRDVLKDMPNVCKCLICVEDLATYVLNRISPYYISSGRGILHLEKDFEPYIQDQADIYTLVLQGTKIIQRRRKEHLHSFPQNGLALLNREEIELVDRYYLNFPYIVGRIMDNVSMRPKGGIKVELSIYQDGKYRLSEMKDPSWINPYVIPSETAGYFTFWPAPVPASYQGEHSKEEANFKINVNDDEYEEEFSIEVLSDKVIKHHINTHYIYELTPILI